MTARRLGVLWALTALVSLVLPTTAQAWWERIEKLSGPGPFWGQVYEFRVACFGEVTPAAAASRTAETSTIAARARPGSVRWRQSLTAWQEAAIAWAAVLGERYTPQPRATTDEERKEAEEIARAAKAGESPRAMPLVELEGFVNEEEETAKALEERGRSKLIATSSVGVFWSLCQSEKNRRVGIDVSWNTFDAEGRPEYAGGAPINLDTLMASVSWRLLPDSKYDFVDVGAGAGVYWFTSAGFPEHHGVVLQPVRVTLRAPPDWSGKKLSDWRRWAALPVYGAGITMFPAGFEADAFAGVGDKAVRLPRELIFSQYFFVNVQPLLQLLRR